MNFITLLLLRGDIPKYLQGTRWVTPGTSRVPPDAPGVPLDTPKVLPKPPRPKENPFLGKFIKGGGYTDVFMDEHMDKDIVNNY